MSNTFKLLALAIAAGLVTTAAEAAQGYQVQRPYQIPGFSALRNATNGQTIVKDATGYTWSPANSAGNTNMSLAAGTNTVLAGQLKAVAKVEVYGLNTDASNYEKIMLTPTGITHERAGTGGNQSITLSPSTGSTYLGKNLVGNRWLFSYDAASLTVNSANASTWSQGFSTELITVAATTNSLSTANLLPANSVIRAVTVRVVSAIPTSTLFDVGDNAGGAFSSVRFATNVLTAAGTTDPGLNHVDQTGDNKGPRQRYAAKILITPTPVPANSNGTVRVTVYWDTFVAPTS